MKKTYAGIATIACFLIIFGCEPEEKNISKNMTRGIWKRVDYSPKQEM